MSFFSFSTAHSRGMVKHSLKGAAHIGQELVGALSTVFSSELSTTSSGNISRVFSARYINHPLLHRHYY